MSTSPAASQLRLSLPRSRTLVLDATMFAASAMESSTGKAFEEMKVPQLKALLKVRGLPVSGKKAVLVARLEE